MTYYNIHEIFNLICEIINDGYHYADIMEIEADEDSPECLAFSAYDPECEAFEDYDTVDALKEEEFHEDSVPHADDFLIGITSKEVYLLKIALEMALNSSKEILYDNSIEKSQKDKIKSLSIDMRNMQARINHTLKVIQSE